MFVDDVNIHNSDWNDHLDHLRLVFQRLRFVNLKLNLGKCYFGAKEIIFLGHVVNWQGSKLNSNKVHVISKFPTPLLVINVWTFLPN
jgi:hypothetical protein